MTRRRLDASWFFMGRPGWSVAAQSRSRVPIDRVAVHHHGREPNPVVDIELQLRFGRAKITVPGNAVVDLDDLRTVWKQPVYQVPQHLDADGPRIRIYGTMEYGRLRIRHKGR